MLIVDIINKELYKKEENMFSGFDRNEIALLNEALARKIVMKDEKIILLFTKYLQVTSFYIAI